MLGADSTTRHTVLAPPVREMRAETFLHVLHCGRTTCMTLSTELSCLSLSISDSSSIPCNTQWSCSSSSAALSVSWTFYSSVSCSDIGLTPRKAREITHCLPGKIISSWRSAFYPSIQHIHSRLTPEVRRSARAEILGSAPFSSERNDVPRITHFRLCVQWVGDIRQLIRHSNWAPFICPQSFAASGSLLLARS